MECAGERSNRLHDGLRGGRIRRFFGRWQPSGGRAFLRLAERFPPAVNSQRKLCERQVRAGIGSRRRTRRDAWHDCVSARRFSAASAGRNGHTGYDSARRDVATGRDAAVNDSRRRWLSGWWLSGRRIPDANKLPASLWRSDDDLLQHAAGRSADDATRHAAADRLLHAGARETGLSFVSATGDGQLRSVHDVSHDVDPSACDRLPSGVGHRSSDGPARDDRTAVSDDAVASATRAGIRAVHLDVSSATSVGLSDGRASLLSRRPVRRRTSRWRGTRHDVFGSCDHAWSGLVSGRSGDLLPGRRLSGRFVSGGAERSIQRTTCRACSERRRLDDSGRWFATRRSSAELKPRWAELSACDRSLLVRLDAVSFQRFDDPPLASSAAANRLECGDRSECCGRWKRGNGNQSLDVERVATAEGTSHSGSGLHANGSARIDICSVESVESNSVELAVGRSGASGNFARDSRSFNSGARDSGACDSLESVD